MIDKTEEKILRMLLNEARTSLTKIAKECNISVPSVNARIKQLKKKEIINGAIMQINPQKLGYSCCGTLEIITEADKKEIVKKIIKESHFFIYDYTYIGKSNISTFYALKNNEKLATLVDSIRSHENVLEARSLIWNDITNMDHPENLVLSIPSKTPKEMKQIAPGFNNDNNNPQNTEKIEKYIQHDYLPKLTEIDVKIAKIISKDARKPFSAISNQLGISTNQVISRYNKLRKEKVISYSSITVNLKRLGYNAMAMLYIKTKPPTKISKIKKQLLQISNVIVAISLLSGFDLIIIVPIINFTDLFNLKSKVLKIHGIT